MSENKSSYTFRNTIGGLISTIVFIFIITCPALGKLKDINVKDILILNFKFRLLYSFLFFRKIKISFDKLLIT